MSGVALSLLDFSRFFGAFACLALPAFGALADEAALTSSDTFLAVDASVFERLEGLSLQTCEAERDPVNPVLRNRPDGPDSVRAGFSGNVLLENGTFRMWYTAHDGRTYRTCYAESDDGRNWRRPDLGLFPYGSKSDSNIVYDEFGLIIPMRDDAEPDAAKRYKSPVFGEVTEAYFNEEQKRRYGKRQPSTRGFAHSPDGLRWVPAEGEPFPLPAKIENVVPYRLHGRYFVVGQMISGEYPEVDRGSRYLAVASSDDMRTWTFADQPGFYFDPRYRGVIQTHISPAYLNYGNVIVGAQGLFQQHSELASQQADLFTLVTSDGFRWRQPDPAQPLSYLLRRGPPGSWDHHFNVQLGLVNRGRRTLLFYAGKPDGGNTPTGGHQIGLATLRLDGYGYLAPAVGWNYADPEFRGSLVTRPIGLAQSGLTLYLNTNGAGRRGAIGVELQDAHGAPLAGYARGDCDPIADDSVGVPVAWRGKSTIDVPPGTKVRVRIDLAADNKPFRWETRTEAPRVYAFYFDRPAIWLDEPQRVPAERGLERLQASDPAPRRIPGFNVVADRPTEVTARRSAAGDVSLTFTAATTATVRWPEGAVCRAGDEEIPFTDGAARCEVRAGETIVVRPRR